MLADVLLVLAAPQVIASHLHLRYFLSLFQSKVARSGILVAILPTLVHAHSFARMTSELCAACRVLMRQAWMERNLAVCTSGFIVRALTTLSTDLAVATRKEGLTFDSSSEALDAKVCVAVCLRRLCIRSVVYALHLLELLLLALRHLTSKSSRACRIRSRVERIARSRELISSNCVSASFNCCKSWRICSTTMNLVTPLNVYVPLAQD